MAELLVASIVLVLLTFTNAEYDVAKYCTLIQPGTKLPSLDSCEKYYTCGLDMKPDPESCTDNYVFDKDAQGCVPQSESRCYFGLSNPCKDKHKQLSYSNIGCNWYTYCIDGKIAGNYTCDLGQRFNAANGTCVNGQCSSNQNSEAPEVCDIMPEGVFFGDTVNCRAWYKCVQGMQLESSVCDNDKIFDVISGYCLTNDGTKCQRTKNAVEGVASGPPNWECSSTDQVVADLNVCSIYYACEPSAPAGTFRWAQKACKSQYFDVVSKTCGGMQTARTFPTCDRCQYRVSSSRNYFVNAVDQNCELYFNCRNGHSVSVEPRPCRDGFFNEAAQACDGDETKLELYKQRNGACQDYSCNEELVCSLAETGNTDIPRPEHDGSPDGDHPANQTIPDNKPNNQTNNHDNQGIKPSNNPSEIKPAESATAH